MIKLLSQLRAVIASTQMGGKGKDKYVFRLRPVGLPERFRGRTGRFGTFRGFRHALKKLRLVKGFIVYKYFIVHFQPQCNSLISGIFFISFRKFTTTVCHYFITHANLQDYFILYV